MFELYDGVISQPLLSMNSALMLADDDDELLTAIDLCFDEPVDLYLFRLKQPEESTIEAILTAAQINSDGLSCPDIGQSFSAKRLPLLSILANFPSGVWTNEYAGSIVNLNPLGIEFGSFIAIKFYQFAPDQQIMWCGFVLIRWPSRHMYTKAEIHTYSLISQIISAVVASHHNLGLRLLRTNSELLLASNFDDVTRCLASITDDVTSIHLLFVDCDSSGLPKTAELSASWRANKIDSAYSINRQFSLFEMPLLMELEQSSEATWFSQQADAKSMLPDCFSNTQAITAVKLYTPGAARDWFAFVLFLWNYPHRLTEQEHYLLNAVSEPTSAFVIGHRRHLEAVKNLEKLRELDRLKDDFLYSMSHELRTPLNGIINAAGLIYSGMEGEISPRVMNDVKIVLESSDHLLSLVQNILDFAKMGSGSLKLDLESLSMVDLVVEALRIAKLNDQAVVLNFSPANIQLMADRTRLRQIFINLLSNASKFAPNGPIEIGGRIEGKMFLLYVRDEGIGISAEHWQDIFEPFRQLDSELTRTYGGTGLGLPITKRLVELHGGRIWVNSAVGKGSTFYFTLPANLEDKAAHENTVH
jgi:signal transduction histidine kinase